MKFQWMQYPTPLRTRTGCKVGWRYYATREEAEQCSKAAAHNAVRQRELGYDFGYCAPGYITEMKDGTFEVCVP